MSIKRKLNLVKSEVVLLHMEEFIDGLLEAYLLGQETAIDNRAFLLLPIGTWDDPIVIGEPATTTSKGIFDSGDKRWIK